MRRPAGWTGFLTETVVFVELGTPTFSNTMGDRSGKIDDAHDPDVVSSTRHPNFATFNKWALYVPIMTRFHAVRPPTQTHGPDPRSHNVERVIGERRDVIIDESAS
ncbi:hypothetical protein GWI33_008396 [Rhynchophorus ferrugineus]|uniref:Uncharacterized protein n=1 Tax=Rhynchophorus ferrugineus TaxID=354439 RepID=A0A834ICS6_RHYFE|nr:hypothetical protein GWI33_008396 [Rhynchophorus ferrugineus]